MATIAANDDPLVEPIPAGLTRTGTLRVDAIDMLRGLVIVLMVLDHVRDFFHADAFLFDPTDPLRSHPILFATRWVTHLCAPTFVFLAGVSILFQRANGTTGWPLSRFLLTRGAWLVLLEVTLVSLGFDFGWPFLFLQVIWAIGISMIAMAALAHLPSRVVLVIGVVLLLGLPFAIELSAGAKGAAAVARLLFLAPGLIPGPVPGLAMYPVLPWLAIMCLGFGLGPVFRLEPGERSRRVAKLALILLASFAVLRTMNLYGDSAPWQALESFAQTAMSWLAVSKYPPSPDYVLVTLGVSMLLFLALERLRGPVARVLLSFGRTPLFTYLAHIYIAHGLMLVAVVASGFPASVALDVIGAQLKGSPPTGWGIPLIGVYGVWLLVVVSLIPLAHWFEGVKRRRRDWWLSYL
jgi:uncharacterized membrane protein